MISAKRLIKLWIILATAIFAAGTLPSVATAQPTTSSEIDALKTAILINAASTKAQVERSEANVRRAYLRLDAEVARKKQALRKLDISERKRRRLSREVTSLRTEQESLLAQMAAQNEEYAATLRAYREGLTGLIQERDPRVLQALERYADGDVRALDDLQQITRLIREARQAGVVAINAKEQRGVAFLMSDARNKSLQTTPVALAAWQEAAGIYPSNFDQWVNIAGLQRSLGNYAEAREAALTGYDLAQNDGEKSAILTELADIALSEGRLSLSIERLEEKLSLLRSQPPESRRSVRYLRDEQQALERLTNIALRQRRLADAARFANERLELAEFLGLPNPDDVRLQTDLVEAYMQVGTVSLARRDLDRASGALLAGLRVAEDMEKSDPTRVPTIYAHSASLYKLGEVAVRQNDLPAARGFFEEGLKKAKRLLRGDPSNEAFQLRVGAVLDQLAFVAKSQNRLRKARRYLKDALRIFRDVHASNPRNFNAHRAVSVSLIKLGDISMVSRRWKAARQYYLEAVVIRSNQLLIDESDLRAWNDLMNAYGRLRRLPDLDTDLRQALDAAIVIDRGDTITPSERELIESIKVKVEETMD